MTKMVVQHKCSYVPAQLAVDASGNTKSGFVCTHLLENGHGPCTSNVFEITEGDMSSCIVDSNHTTDHPECPYCDPANWIKNYEGCMPEVAPLYFFPPEDEGGPGV